MYKEAVMLFGLLCRPLEPSRRDIAESGVVQRGESELKAGEVFLRTQPGPKWVRFSELFFSFSFF